MRLRIKLVLVVVLILISCSIFVDAQIKKPSFDKISSRYDKLDKAYVGRWIVQLNEDSLSKKYLEYSDLLIDKSLSESEISVLAAENQEKFKDYKNKILKSQDELLEKINRIVKSNGENKRFKNVFNGFTISATKEEISKIRQINGVANVFEDKLVEIDLYDSVPLINANDVWSLQDEYGVNLTGKNVTIVILDTGIDYTHIDLGNCTPTSNISTANCSKVIDGYDFVNDDGNPIDDHGHGTHVASTAAGNGTQNGVAPDAHLVAYKVIDSAGKGLTSNIISAIELATDPNNDGNFSDHYDIISISLGSEGNPNDEKSIAVDNAVALGVVVVVAAGNDYGFNDINSPGTARKAITVGSSDDSDEFSSFSSEGPTDIGTLKPDLVAPGEYICAAQHGTYDPEFLPGACLDSVHVRASGTSMSAPHVSGVVALMLQNNSNRTPEQIKAILRNTAIDINALPQEQGWGRVDALAAINFQGECPIAEINASSRFFNDTVIITGYVYSENFSNYTIEYAESYNATNWTMINYTNNLGSNYFSFSWDTTTIADGEYTIKLNVTSKNGLSSDDKLLVEVNNIIIDNPLSYEYYVQGEIINISGTVKGTFFDNYTLEYGFEDNITVWNSSGVILSNGGTLEIFNETLATLNTTNLEDNVYILKLTVFSSDSLTKNETSTFIVGQGQQNNFPLSVDQGISSDSLGIGELSAVSGKELVFGDSQEDAFDSKIYAFFSNGSLMPNWPIETDYEYIGTPVLVDINGDGIEEIFVGAYADSTPERIAVFGLYANASNISGWPIEETGTNTWLVSVQITMYEDEPVIVTTTAEDIFAWYSNGTELSGFPLGFGSWRIPAIADLDSDGINDLVIQKPYNGTYAYSLDGDSLSGFPIIDENECEISWDSNPVVGDIDNDGDLEILISSQFCNTWGHISIYNSDGSNYSCSIYPNNESSYDEWEISLADLDDDNTLEIIFQSLEDGYPLYIYNHDCLPYENWTNPSWDSGNTIVGDINGDSYQNLLTFWDYLFIYNLNGSNLTGWPKKMPDYNRNGFFREIAPQLADIDNDKDLEIIVNKNSDVFVWDLNTTYDPRTIEWGTTQGDRWHSGLYKDPNRFPLFTNFDGHTTYFEYEYDISSVDNSVIEKSSFGKIEFLNNSMNYTSLDLDSNVNLSYAFVSINITELPELNVSANISIYNLNLSSPVILVKDNSVWNQCPESICKVIEYSNGTLVFNVSGFNSYKAIEGVSVNLNSPQNIYWASTSINLSCNASSDSLTNISLYSNQSTWGVEETTLISVNNVSANFTLALSNFSRIVWNCYACNEDNLCEFASENYTIYSEKDPKEILNMTTTTNERTFFINLVTFGLTNISIDYDYGIASNESFSTNHTIILSSLSSNTTYNYSIVLCSQSNNCNNSNYTFTTLPLTIILNESAWNDSTTNFSNLNDSFLENMSNVTFVNTYGIIFFTDILNITKSLNLTEKIVITNNSIFINSTYLEEFNKSAILTLYNINLIDPVIMVDGILCSTCEIINYSNNTLTFNVSHFTNYTSAENPCGNGAIDFGEDCDGLNLNGNDCADLGYIGGTLFCSETCSYLTSSCLSGGSFRGGGGGGGSYSNTPDSNITNNETEATDVKDIVNVLSIENNDSENFLGAGGLQGNISENKSIDKNDSENEIINQVDDSLFWLWQGLTILLILIICIVAYKIYTIKYRSTYVNKELKQYVITAIKYGYSKELITKKLLDENWPVSEIDKVFKNLKK